MAGQAEALLMTRQAAASRAGISVQTIEKELDAGNLRACRIRGRIMIHPNDFDEWLNRCRGLGGPEEEVRHAV